MTGQALAPRQPKRRAASIRGTTIVLAAVAAGLVGARLGEVSLPIVSSDRVALIALVTVGIGLCTSGPLGQLVEAKSWLSPFFLVGVASGAVILVASAAFLLGGAPLGFADDRAALAALAVAIALKLAVGMAYRVTRLR